MQYWIFLDYGKHNLKFDTMSFSFSGANRASHLLASFRLLLNLHALSLNNCTKVLSIPVLRGRSLNLSNLLSRSFLFLC